MKNNMLTVGCGTIDAAPLLSFCLFHLTWGHQSKDDDGASLDPLDQEKEKEGPATTRGFQLEAASSELLLRTLGYQGDR